MAEAPLLYLLGGPMRSGKSIIAARFNRLTGISVISTDDLVHMLTLAAPQLGISDEDDGDPWGETGWRVNRERLAPFVEALADIRIGEERPLLIEGELHPDSISRLLTSFGSRVRACYVGSITTDVDGKAYQLRSHSETARHDWLKGRSDPFIQRTAEEVLSISKELEAAAREINVPFFDLHPNFDAAIEMVAVYLSSGLAQKD